MISSSHTALGASPPPDAANESWFVRKDNRKTKLQASAASGRKTLQSQTSLGAENKLTFNYLARRLWPTNESHLIFDRLNKFLDRL